MSIIPENLAAPIGLPTDRLVLEPMTAAVVDALIIQVRQPDWAADFPAPADYDAARQFFETGLLTDTAAVFGTRLIRERSTGDVVGTIGFTGIPVDEAIEVSYSIVPSRRGQGYASEALVGLARYALDQPGVSVVTAFTETSNLASQALLLTAGFMPVEVPGMSLQFELRRSQLPEANR